jgi:hypothetical protein
MTMASEPNDWVGPVLEKGAHAEAVLAAIREENEGAKIIDRGSYVRVLVRLRCSVTRAAIEAHVQRPFALPTDLEIIMPSFKGRFEVSEDRASWSTGTSHAK